MLETLLRTPDTAADDYETAIEEAIATCNSDIRGALKALLIANELLEAEVAQLRRRGPSDARDRYAAHSLAPYAGEGWVDGLQVASNPD